MPDGEAVPDDGGGAGGEAEQLGAAHQLPNRGGDNPLEQVAEHDQRPGSLTEHPGHVGGPRVAAPLGVDVHTAAAGHQHRKVDTADQVAGDDGEQLSHCRRSPIDSERRSRRPRPP